MAFLQRIIYENENSKYELIEHGFVIVPYKSDIKFNLGDEANGKDAVLKVILQYDDKSDPEIKVNIPDNSEKYLELIVINAGGKDKLHSRSGSSKLISLGDANSKKLFLMFTLDPAGPNIQFSYNFYVEIE